MRDIAGAYNFVKKSVQSLGIKDYEIIVLDDKTRGQAETVALALEKISYEGSITIFNIDTFRPNFKFPLLEKNCDGYLEVFYGEGSNWSFVKPLEAGSTQVIETAEKKAISNLCCTGLYYFDNVDDYLRAFQHYLSMPVEQWDKAELYVAPLYNHLIKNKKNICYHLINRAEVVFCGTPEEYFTFLEQ